MHPVHRELAEETDLQAVRSALAEAPVGEPVRYRVERILARPDLTRRDCFDVRVALQALRASTDRLHGVLAAFGPVERETREARTAP